MSSQCQTPYSVPAFEYTFCFFVIFTGIYWSLIRERQYNPQGLEKFDGSTEKNLVKSPSLTDPV